MRRVLSAYFLEAKPSNDTLPTPSLLMRQRLEEQVADLDGKIRELTQKLDLEAASIGTLVVVVVVARPARCKQ